MLLVQLKQACSLMTKPVDVSDQGQLWTKGDRSVQIDESMFIVCGQLFQSLCFDISIQMDFPSLSPAIAMQKCQPRESMNPLGLQNSVPCNSSDPPCMASPRHFLLLCRATTEDHSS